MFETLMEKLKTGRYVTLETTPSHSPSFQPVIEQITNLSLDTLVDGFSTTDNPLAKLKYNALFAAMHLQNAFGKPVLATMSMRDRNRIALQSDLLGANDADVRAILALTGDPAQISDQKEAKGVFEGNSSLLLDMIVAFNQGSDLEGKDFKIAPKPLYPFAVINATAKNPNNLKKRMINKMEHGAVGIITQPVYDVDTANRLLDLMEEARVATGAETQLILGLFPITKLRTAQFLDANVPGVHVPSPWITTLQTAQEKGTDMAYRVGFDLSKKLFDDIIAIHPKIHLMTANQFDVAQKIITA